MNIGECRYYERLNSKKEGSKDLVYTGLSGYELFIIRRIKRELNRRLIYECRCDDRLEPTPVTSSTWQNRTRGPVFF